MEHPSITYAESPTALTGSSEAEYLDALHLFMDVRKAVDQGLPVHLEWCDVNERWEVDVDGVVVWSVEEALERTKELI